MRYSSTKHTVFQYFAYWDSTVRSCSNRAGFPSRKWTLRETGNWQDSPSSASRRRAPPSPSPRYDPCERSPPGCHSLPRRPLWDLRDSAVISQRRHLRATELQKQPASQIPAEHLALHQSALLSPLQQRALNYSLNGGGRKKGKERKEKKIHVRSEKGACNWILLSVLIALESSLWRAESETGSEDITRCMSSVAQQHNNKHANKYDRVVIGTKIKIHQALII